jgi:hypothetical protein
MRHRYYVAGHAVSLNTEQLLLLPWLCSQFRRQVGQEPGRGNLKARLQYDLAETLTLLVTCDDDGERVSLGIIGALQCLPDWVFDPNHTRRDELPYAQARTLVTEGPERLGRWKPRRRWVCQRRRRLASTRPRRHTGADRSMADHQRPLAGDQRRHPHLEARDIGDRVERSRCAVGCDTQRTCARPAFGGV